MDNYNAKQIAQLTSATQAFYEQHAASFSQTRQRGWVGWTQLVPYLSEVLHETTSHEGITSHCFVLDVACGNFRFAGFLSEQFPESAWHIHGIDACDSLASCIPELADHITVSFEHEDIIANLSKGKPLIDDAHYDVAVCFGFMHHLPTVALRQQLLEEMISAIKPGGLIALSFWRFLEDEKLAHKAAKTTDIGEVRLDIAMSDKQDRLLGWQNNTEQFRYCHSFSGEEIDLLISSVSESISVLDRYYADGKSGLLNEYVVLKRRKDR